MTQPWNHTRAPSKARIRVAIAVSHPIQHFCPLYAFLAQDPRLDVMVIFGVTTGSGDYFDSDFHTTINTGVQGDLKKFDHSFVLDTDDLEAEQNISPVPVWRMLNEFEPDIVVVYGLHRRSSRWAWLWSCIKRRPIAYISDSEDRGLRKRSRSSIQKAKFVFSLTSRMLAVGDANTEFYRTRGVQTSKISLVPFPIDRLRYEKAYAKRQQLRVNLRKSLGLESQFVLMTCGKLIGRKRQRDVISAVATLDSQNCAVLLVGSGEDEASLLQAGHDLGVRVIVTGFVNPHELPSYYFASDVYVHPSDFDPHPLAISEAIYCGLPVLVSDHVGSSGPTDDVQPGVNGQVFRMGDISDLASYLRVWADDNHKLIDFGRASRRVSLRRQEMAYEGFANVLVGLVQ